MTTLTILNDLGGGIVAYALIARDATVEVLGVCASACTLFLSSPEVCIGPEATFIFHEPHGPNAEWGEAFLMQSYPAWTRDWITTQGGLSSELLILPASIAAAYIEACS